MDGVNRAMAEIEEYDYESGGELIEWLRDNILEGNLDEIAVKLAAFTEQGEI
jgi:hypothetical protein